MLSTVRRLLGSAMVVALAVMFPVTANAAETTNAPRALAVGAAATADGGNLVGDQAGKQATASPQAAGEDVKAQAWYYHITSSCRGYENAIVRGADFWGGGVRTASSGTPVSCTSGYVQGCGGTYVVGCNWGQGQRIALSTRVNDFALLSAHEFGHNWYGHSAQGCASWGSIYNVMKTNMC
ncbi:MULTISPECIES: hypothetical protein [Streptomyces]|uniref:hypothetical protein n=1 Tax=Streptomyces TaxID=1883 RepID=UPI002248B778|nr:hypothetical protein [Streptomyces sp. JHD 1]MCX2968877.1 hypothetical protein [Streptomyces sp. JHD 1]